MNHSPEQFKSPSPFSTAGRLVRDFVDIQEKAYGAAPIVGHMLRQTTLHLHIKEVGDLGRSLDVQFVPIASVRMQHHARKMDDHALNEHGIQREDGALAFYVGNAQVGKIENAVGYKIHSEQRALGVSKDGDVVSLVRSVSWLAAVQPAIGDREPSTSKIATLFTEEWKVGAVEERDLLRLNLKGLNGATFFSISQQAVRTPLESQQSMDNELVSNFENHSRDWVRKIAERDVKDAPTLSLSESTARRDNIPDTATEKQVLENRRK